MSDFSDAKTSVTETGKSDGPKPPSRPKPRPAAAPGVSAQWPTLAALALAVIALVAAILAYFQLGRGTSYSDDEIANAKAEVCAAFGIASRAVHSSTTNTPNDNVGFIINARLAWLSAGAYVQESVQAHPALAGDIAEAASAWGEKSQELGLNYLASPPFTQANQAVVDGLLNDANAKGKAVSDLCA